MAGDRMIPFPAQTARFRQVVQRCGRPRMHLSLMAAGRDRALQGLERQGRVMTLPAAHRGQGVDYGLIGVFEERGAQFLVFERTLRPFAGRRIVGIDYTLVNGASAEGTPGTATRRPAPKPVRSAQRSTSSAPPAPVSAPDPPPGPTEIREQLRQIQRLLAARHYTRATEGVDRLVERMNPGG